MRFITQFPLLVCLLFINFDAQAQTSNCSNTTTWNGTNWNPAPPTNESVAIFTGNYDSTGDLSACSVVIENGAVVTFKEVGASGHTLRIENEFQITNGFLVFENNTSLIQISDAENIGNITYKRRTKAINEYDFTYWSSPVSNQTLHALSPDTSPDKYMEYDAASNSWGIILNGSAEMQPAKGYIVRGPENQVEFQTYNANFTGEPHNGTISTAIAGPGNYNLIGNPYPSAVDADCLINDSENSAMNGALYFWTHNLPISQQGNFFNYNLNDYAVYNLLGGVGTGIIFDSSHEITTERPTGKIAAGTAFFVKGLSEGSVKFKNSMRLGSEEEQNSQFFRSSDTTTSATVSQCAVEKHRLWLQIENRPADPESPILFKQTLIGYTEDATTSAALDRNYDAEILSTNAAINLYSLSPDGLPLTIQGRALSGMYSNSEVIPLGIKCPAGDHIKISVSEDDGLFDQRIYYLRELISGSGSNAVYAYHDIKNSPFVFSSPVPVESSTRFAIVFAHSGPSIRESYCGNVLEYIYTSILTNTETVQGAVTAYKFRITNLSDPDEVQYYTTDLPRFQLTKLNSYEYGTSYQVEVAVEAGGYFGNYGPSCIISTPSLFSGSSAIYIPQCETVLAANYSPIFIKGPSMIQGYKIFVQMLDANNDVIEENTIERTDSWFKISNVVSPASGTTYRIQAAVKTTGEYSEYCAPCLITTPGTSSARIAASAGTAIGIQSYPNPFTDSFKLNLVNSGKAMTEVSVYDLLGRLLESYKIQPNEIDGLQFGESYPSGVYNVIVSHGDSVETIRVVKR